jgi:hypothetical protein
MRRKKTDKYILSSSKFIEKIGITKLAQECNLTYQTVYQWKKIGIPAGWAMFFRTQQPYKQIWFNVFEG